MGVASISPYQLTIEQVKSTDDIVVTVLWRLLLLRCSLLTWGSGFVLELLPLSLSPVFLFCLSAVAG